MVAFIFEGIELDVCPDCGGVWLDRGELEDLARDSGEDSQATDALRAELMAAPVTRHEKKRLCPRSGQPMELITLPALPDGQPAVQLDRSPGGHGFFFDRGELALVLQRYHGPESPLSRKLAEFFGPSFFQTGASGSVRSS
jgi:Zn-finger nucleic acid-binding protein